MPRITPQTFKYYYASNFLAKGKTFDSGYFLGLDLGSNVFGVSMATLPDWDAKLVLTKYSRLVSNQRPNTCSKQHNLGTDKKEQVDSSWNCVWNSPY